MGQEGDLQTGIGADYLQQTDHQSAQSGQAEHPVVADAAAEEGQNDQGQRGGIHHAEDGRGDGDDLIDAKVGDNGAEQADETDQDRIGESPAGEAGEVVGAGADQAHRRGNAGQGHHDGKAAAAQWR